MPKLASADLRVFAAIAACGGITAAARMLGLTKSQVSRALAALEERLGTRLVQRTTRRLSLTDTGELLAAYARRVAAEMDEAEAAIEAMRAAPRGVLRVSVPFSVLRFVLIPRLAAFRARHPGIRLALDASTRRVDLVEEGFDIAIRIGALPSSSLVARRLALVPQILAAAPAYLARRPAPRGPADLAGHDLIHLGREIGPQDWTLTGADGAAATVRVTPAVAIQEPSVVRDLIAQGLGIGAVPDLYVRGDLAAGVLAPVLPGLHRALVPIHAVYPSRRILAPKVRAFVDFASEAFAAAG